jgi:CubicO group peptidase (beta-lactamase class C family)
MASTLRAETTRALHRRLAEEQSEHRLPSIAACIVRAGRVIWSSGVGEIEGRVPAEDTQYRCGSISKTFVAVEIMRLRDENKLDLDDQVGTYVPEIAWLRATIAQLLSHTSGLRSETAGPWWERTEGVPFDSLVNGSLREGLDSLAPSGRRFHYSNLGYGVLGEVVSRIRQRAWQEVIADELLDPLGMVRTTTRPIPPFARGYAVHPHADVVLPEPEHDAGAMAAAGQLWSTTDDLGKWLSLLCGEQPELISPDTLEEMRSPVAVADLPDLPWTTAHGLGLQLFNDKGRRSFGHGGSMPGFLAMLLVDASTSDGVVVLVNATSGLGALATDLLALLHESEPAEPPIWRPMPGGLSSEVLDITGTWYWGTSALVISVSRSGLLELRALGAGREASFSRLSASPNEPERYIGLSGYYHGEILKVERNSDGSLSHLDIGSFILTRTPYDTDAPIPGGVHPLGWSGGSAPPDHLLRGHVRWPHLKRTDADEEPDQGRP